VGVSVYFLFGGRKLRRMVRRRQSLYGGSPKRDFSEATPAHIAEQILVSVGMPPGRSGNQIEFLPDAEAGYAALVSLIEQSQRSIHVMTFILHRDETGRAWAEDVSTLVAPLL